MAGCNCHCPTDPGFADYPFKGLRARSVATHVQKAIEDLQRRRDTLQPPAFCAIDTTTVYAAMNKTIALLETKFIWVREFPYLIWQASGTERCLTA